MRTNQFQDKEYEIKQEITEYENGVYTHYAFDGCFNHSYLYRNLTLSEIYHVLTGYQVVINETEKKIEIPKFIQKKENEYIFEGGGLTEDLKIIDNRDGTFVISSYDCT